MKVVHYYIIFLVIMAAGLGVYFAANQGWYPVVIINSRFISARAWTKQIEAASQYYRVVLQASNLPQDVVEEIRRSALDKLVENAIIYGELKSGADNVDALVAAKLDALKLDSGKIGEASAALYGLEFNEFKELVLVPEARREILFERLTQNQVVEVKAKASVTLLTNNFYWNGERVETK